MDDRVYGSSSESSILSQIREGMVVIDLDNEKIGKVRDIRFGEADETSLRQGRGPATASAADPAGDPAVLPDFAAGFVAGPQEGPESDLILKQMQRSGYIIIDASGLFANDRYALTEQIQSVKNDEVFLNIKRDQLVKRR
jgi:hypothetical protein